MKEAINKAAFIGMIVFNIAMFFTMKNDYWYLMYLLWGDIICNRRINILKKEGESVEEIRSEISTEQ